VKPYESNPALSLTDPRDRDAAAMSLEQGLLAHEKFHKSYNDRLHMWLAVGTPRGNSEDFHAAVGSAAYDREIGITMHCAEAPKDLEIYHDLYHCSPMEFCERTRIAGPRTVLAHMVNLDLDRDLDILKRTGTTVAHNPSSNCKLASGIAAIPDMLSKGVNVGLGTDGAPCANTYDMIREMNLASILQSGHRQTAGILPAVTALEMATINGAKALGIDKDVGSLEVGKKSDFVVVNPYTLASATAPWDHEQLLEGGIDPVTALIHSCTGRDVDMVVVDGRILVKAGILVNVDEAKILKEARTSIKGIRNRSGVTRQQPSLYNLT
jgi:cytosine/adenosine deaminase-related metal-dependent hydrolase